MRRQLEARTAELEKEQEQHTKTRKCVRPCLHHTSLHCCMRYLELVPLQGPP